MLSVSQPTSARLQALGQVCPFALTRRGDVQLEHIWGRWKKISSVEEQEYIILGSFSACESEKLCWELCRHFLPFTNSCMCCSVDQYPFSPVSSPKKVQINISYCISKQSTYKPFISIHPHSKSGWNLSLPFIQKCSRNIYPQPDFTVWTSKRGRETMGFAQSERVQTTKPGCVSFLNAADRWRLKRCCSEGFAVKLAQAVC